MYLAVPHCAPIVTLPVAIGQEYFSNAVSQTSAAMALAASVLLNLRISVNHTLPSYILHPEGSSLQLPASRTAALVATLVVATLGDVLFARCSGSSLRVNLLPTHLVGELAAELRGQFSDEVSRSEEHTS